MTRTAAKRIALAALLLAAGAGNAAQAKLHVFACEPEWGALLQELAGDAIDVDVATSGLQDVHQIEAKPSLIAKVRKADLSVCTGAELEIGWLPQLVRQSGNDKLAGGAGVFAAASVVKTLQKPAVLDRAAGDVHPMGNPHIQMDPYRVLAVAKVLDARLVQLDPANAAVYQKRFADFSARWSAAIKRWEAKAAPL
jgi:zinc/manganese transport system substrate-binding protein